MNIHRKHFERIVIIGPREDSQKAFDYCAKHRYHIAVRVDGSRFKIIAEREVAQ